MNNMIRGSLIVATLVVCGIGAMAQETVQKFQDTSQKARVGSRIDFPKDEAGRKRLERQHYRRTLGLDSARADQVLKVQSDYKSAVARVVSDTSLNDVGKRAAIDRLILHKNSQLERLLTPAQQARAIPTTERRPSAGRAQ